MIDFEKFDNAVDTKALQKEVAEAKTFTDVPNGTYIVAIDKMEIKPTKKNDKLMFSIQCKIKEGQQKGRMIFMNRVISGNRATDTWGDGKAIKSVVDWVNKLEPVKPVKFVTYSDFAEKIMDVYQDLQNTVEIEVDYNADKFDPIIIKEVFDL